MKNKYSIFIITTFLLFVAVISSCSKKEDLSRARSIVINELMASNRTGLLAENGKPADWIELKNTSADTINLKGYGLALVKMVKDSVAENGMREETVTWDFPEVKIAGGECLVVFADKVKEEKDEEKGNEKGAKDKKDKGDKKKKDKGKGEDTNSLVANFKLPKEGATVQFVSPRGTVIRELKYGELNNDMSLSRQPDSTYVATYWQSPGFENTPEGYEAAVTAMDKQRKDPLKIWEVMSRAKRSNENWVELKNTGDVEIDLSEYALSKKVGKKEEKFSLPDRKLQPGQFITIQMAGKKANKNNPLHAPFKLGQAETVVLTKKDKFIDGVNAKLTIYGGSIGRAVGNEGFFYYATPTRNEENGKEARRFVAEMPQFDHKPGIYGKEEKITLRLKDKNREVHYTLDGSEPTANSSVLKDSLLITKNTVVRTFAKGDSATLRSNVATATYLLGVEHEVPVMNITVNKNDLYNYSTGIYVEGPGYTEEWPHRGANYWQKWTKKAHVELFDDKEGLSVDCGLRIFGGFSRAEEKKSFRLKFRPEYGNSKINYDFFGEGEPLELEDLVVRSGSQDYNRCMIRDEFFTTLMKEQSPTLLIQKYRPVALYINAEYFGLYYLRDKIDKHFVARHLNLPTDSINIIMSVGYNEEGSVEPYKQFMKYVSSHDMTNKENYEYVKKNVDLQGLIDYKLGEIYSGNSDVGNIRYVRSTHPKSDKKWHFVFYDLDASWVGYKPPASFYLAGGNSTVSTHNVLINRLLANKEFRAIFLERLSHHLTHTFSTENTTALFDKMVAQIRPEMKRNSERWPSLSYNQWEKNIESFREKFSDKNKVMLNDIREYLQITPEENKKYFSHLGY